MNLITHVKFAVGLLFATAISGLTVAIHDAKALDAPSWHTFSCGVCNFDTLAEWQSAQAQAEPPSNANQLWHRDRGSQIMLSAEDCALIKVAVERAPDVTPMMRQTVIEDMASCQGLGGAPIALINRILMTDPDPKAQEVLGRIRSMAAEMARQR